MKWNSQTAWKISAAGFSRLVLNTARRFAYPFAPVLSRGLGVPLTSITSLIAINQATSVLGIFFGPLSDHLGYKLMMSAGLTLLALGMFAGGFFPYYGVILISLLLAGLAKSIFDPALQAYVGEKVPIQRRGLVIGILEISWAGSTLVGIPLVGLVIDGMGWQASFLVLGGCGLLGLVAVRWFIPSRSNKKETCPLSKEMTKAWKSLLRNRASMGMLGFAFFVSAANDNLFVIYGAWLEESFSVTILALGLGTSVIGVAELFGECLTAGLSDRFGLKRSLLWGLILSMISYGILPLIGTNLASAWLGLFLVFLSFEFAIVTAMSLSTELMPKFRATMMSGLMAAAGAGRVMGALMGGPLWFAGGITATGWVSFALSGLGLASLIWGLWGKKI